MPLSILEFLGICDKMFELKTRIFPVPFVWVSIIVSKISFDLAGKLSFNSSSGKSSSVFCIQIDCFSIVLASFNLLKR